MSTQINMKEIAEKAGVSIATVSRVINNNGRFSKETGERVRRIIEETGYVQNMSGRALRTSRTQSVGVIVPDITNPHFSTLVMNIQMALFRSGYSCIICNTNESDVLEKKHIANLRSQNIAGIILISGTRYYMELRKLPCVYLDRPSTGDDEGGIIIGSDNEAGGYLAGSELIKAGCRDIVVLMSQNTDVNQRHRFAGFKRALRENGIEFDENKVINISNVSSYSGKAAITALLKKKVPFDGIMTTTDTLAAGAYLALRDRKIKIPEQVKITGFDDCAIAEICGNGITSVKQDVTRMANMAVELMIQQIEGGKVPAFKRVLPVTLSKRQSTEYR